MKIGVLSDTHISGKKEKLPKEIEMAFKGVDMIVHVGDLTDLTVLNRLRELCPDVKAVWGNMDPLEVREALPEKEVFTAGGFKICLMHGYGAPNNLINLMADNFKNEKPDVIIFGHSHFPVNEKRDDILYFNPGSATDKIYAPFNSYGIIEINDSIKAKIYAIDKA